MCADRRMPGRHARQDAGEARCRGAAHPAPAVDNEEAPCPKPLSAATYPRSVLTEDASRIVTGDATRGYPSDIPSISYTNLTEPVVSAAIPPKFV